MALREIGCDLTDAELRGLNRPDAEAVPLRKVVRIFRAPAGRQRLDTKKQDGHASQQGLYARLELE